MPNALPLDGRTKNVSSVFNLIERMRCRCCFITATTTTIMILIIISSTNKLFQFLIVDWSSLPQQQQQHYCCFLKVLYNKIKKPRYESILEHCGRVEYYIHFLAPFYFFVFERQFDSTVACNNMHHALKKNNVLHYYYSSSSSIFRWR